MLKARVITALFLVVAVWGVLFYFPLALAAVVFGLLPLIGANEWANMVYGVSSDYSRWERGVYVLIIALLMLVCWFFLDSQGRYLLQIVSICGWGGGVGALVFYQKGREWKRIPVIFGAILGIWLLVPAWLAIIDLLGQPQKGPGWVLLLMVIVWGADSGAYFVGKRFGRHLLASRLSPAKTLEGLLGGMLSAILLAYAGFMVLGEQAQFFPRGLILALFVSLFSVVGDLFESMMKRIAGVKDSGNLLPGHGGVLDRIDSLTAAAPAFWLGVVFVQGTGV